ITKTTDGAVDLKATGNQINATKALSFSGTVGSIQLPEPGTPIANYTGTIAWGDGKSSTATLALQNGNTIVFTGKHTYAKAGTYKAQLELKGGLSVTTMGSATVAAPTGSITGTVFNDVNGNKNRDA